MNDIVHSIAAIFAGITGVAILAVLVSRNSNTTGVITAASGAYNSGLATALSPITGSSNSNSLGAGVQY